jgi:anti-sigma factor RsiW
MERLSEYIDGDLDPSERGTLEAHLSGCADCRSALADLKLVRAHARKLREEPVPAEIWSRIEAAITAGRKIPFPADRIVSRSTDGADSGRGARFSFSLPELIAACLAIAVLSGGLVFALVRHPGSRIAAPVLSVASAPESTAPARASAPEPTRIAEREARAPAQTILAERTRDVALAPGRTVETPHEEAIAELRKALARERDRLDPATIRTLEANLAIIDLAIDQAKRALAADPANTYVKEHLADTMRRRVELLQRATMLASTSDQGESR